MTSEHEVESFTEFLKRRGLKLTAQRRRILVRALEEPNHFSAEKLLNDLRREDASTSKATVYRTLALLTEALLLDSVDFERGYRLYERATLGHEHHDHLICTECDRVVEFHDEKIEKAQGEVAKAHDFEVLWHTHKLYGRCSECRARSTRRQAPRAPATKAAGRPSRKRS
jgi:Fur family ferric uptake transcriptional regulator